MMRRTHRLGILLLAYTLSCPIPGASQGTTSTNAVVPPANTRIRVASLPQWDTEDQKLMLQGKWFAGEDILPTDEDPPQDAPALSITNLVDNGELPSANPLIIPPEFLPRYIPQDANIQLLDPQSLLTEQEQEDIRAILAEIKKETEVTVYLALFNKGQQIPAAINAPPLARRIFKEDAPSILVEFHLGELTKSQIVYSEDIGFCLDDNKRKDLLDLAQKKAAEYTEDNEILWHYLYHLGQQIPGIKRLVENSPIAPKIKLPDVGNLLENKGNLPPEQPKINLKKSATQFWKEHGEAIGFFAGIAILITLSFFYWREKKVYPLKSSPAQKRLGAPQGSNTSRPIYYSSSTPAKSKQEQNLLRDFFNTKK